MRLHNVDLQAMEKTAAEIRSDACAPVAAAEGIDLQELRAAGEFELTFAKVFGVADEPIVDGLRISLTVRSGADRTRLEAALRQVEERCPAAFCLKSPIQLAASIAAA